MPQPHQKAALALLLGTPSTLNLKWEANVRADIEKELSRLKFSAKVDPTPIQLMDEIEAKGKKPVIIEASKVLLDVIWDGAEPHPDDDDAVRLVAAARLFDNE